jgi:hypothetical protein
MVDYEATMIYDLTKVPASVREQKIVLRQWMSNPNEFNFVSNTTKVEDIDLFLGPLEPDKDGPIITFDEHWSMANVMHAAGIFKSVGEARRNGWGKPIPDGFQHLIVTKRKINIFTLKC